MKKILIALGGNALLKKGQKPTIKTQARNIKQALRGLFPIVKKNRVVITHGNGPAVGYLLIKNELAQKQLKIPVKPLDVLGAQTEGQIGYLIQQNLHNLFRKNNIKRDAVTLLTQVLVNKSDRAFRNPSKFIGPFYTKREAKKLKRRFTIKEDIGRGWRRVVPSPKPIKIIESDVISKLLKQKAVVIAVGGGGIPVVQKSGKLKGIEAVIDKDLASACLASAIKANILVMVTDVDAVYLNYKKKDQKVLRKARLKDLKKYYAAGHFPPGSMGPKVEASINFLENGGKKVIITSIKNIENAIKEKAGTIIR